MIDRGDRTIFLGPPGTGKTHRLLNILQTEIASGVNSRRIGFVAFTKKAAQLAKDRAIKDCGLSEDDLPFFRTLHSLAFRQLGLKRDQVMQWAHYKELGEKLGMALRGRKNVEDGTTYGMTKEERLMFIEGLSRIKMENLKQTWSDADEEEVDWWELERYSRALKEYKSSRLVIDYTDMMENFVKDAKFAAPPLDVVIVDEAQDLSAIQWAAVDKISEKAMRIYIAGDDDQCIYKWAGADVQRFIDLQGRVTVLDQSKRVPNAIHQMAENITRQIVNRRPKMYRPKQDDAGKMVEGEVKYYGDAEEVDLREGSWLLLARNGYQLLELEEMCIRNGYSFESVSSTPLHSDSLKALLSWETLRKNGMVPVEEAVLISKFMTPGQGISKNSRDALKKADTATFVGMQDLSKLYEFSTVAPWFDALDRIPDKEREYFRAALKRKETLTRKPRIAISTIHGAKGGEAENVLLLTDMSYRTFTQMQKYPDDEHRVFYVAITRTSQSLHIIAPKTNLCYEL